MSQYPLSPNLNKNICEGVKCDAEATIEIVLKVNEQRAISLRLCKECLKKFE